jgi:acetate kinase
VHGGDLFDGPTRIDDDMLSRLDALVPLAPLHQPHNIAAIRAVAAARPELPQVACFDTAFHSTHRRLERMFALPRALYESGVRRYGFHGLSYEHVAAVLPDVVGARARGRVVAAHLGNGASLCAMSDGRSAASTMGFTALDGLMMGTRSGSVDPGVLLHLLQFGGMDVARLSTLLYQESGLLGVSGLSHDMRVLLASAEAREAIDLYCYRITRELGSLAAMLGGLDVLVFTGGIGENAAPIRAQVCAQAQWLGVRLDAAANAGPGPVISLPESPVDVIVVRADEERVIAAQTTRVALAVMV